MTLYYVLTNQRNIYPMFYSFVEAYDAFIIENVISGVLICHKESLHGMKTYTQIL